MTWMASGTSQKPSLTSRTLSCTTRDTYYPWFR
jgi:hypothetical protein